MARFAWGLVWIGIQRVVQASSGRLRACYEAGRVKNPALKGHVAVSFVIGRDGAASQVAGGASTLQDDEVVSCVVRIFEGLSFPQPEGGVVTVAYPIVKASILA